MLSANGATFTTKDTDFVTSTNRDFHPTDVLEDADGSLLVIDTGGWYKLCCPTSQLAKPDVLGGIYRITRRGAVAPRDPRGLALDWPAMPSARLAALARRSAPGRAAAGDSAAGEGGRRAPLRRLSDALTRRRLDRTLGAMPCGRSRASTDPKRALPCAGPRWTIVIRRCATRPCTPSRSGGMPARSLKCARHWHRTVACHPARRRRSARPHRRRGVPCRICWPRRATRLDRTLEHSLTYALIEIADRGVDPGGADRRVRSGRGARRSIALDQMTPPSLERRRSCRCSILRHDDEQDGVVDRRAPSGLGRGAAWLLRPAAGERRTQGRARRAWSKSSRSSARIRRSRSCWRASPTDGSPEARVIALRVMAASKARELPRLWIAPLIAGARGRGRRRHRAAVGSGASACRRSKEASAVD